MYTWVCSPALSEVLGAGSDRCALPRPGAQVLRRHASLRQAHREYRGDPRGCTCPPTKPSFSLWMLVCVSVSVFKSAFESFSLLLNNFRSCQGKSLCLEGTGRGVQGGLRIRNQLVCRLPFSSSKSYTSRLTSRPLRWNASELNTPAHG